MPDPRFFETLGPVSVSDLALAGGAELADPTLGERLIATVAPLDGAGPDAVSFLSDPRRAAGLSACKAGAIFMKPQHREFAPDGCAALLTSHPQAAWAAAVARLYAPRRHEPGSAAIHPS
ncbi:UDP-3-O-(3-hydroxymyristoyl)glucosamine N-acyltransferase, partial [Caulobacter sp. D4A]|uniref:LpxD N-terminal domain-containing protein n=1 Tax=Caulobacter sp. D4A TaxID=2204171 RepID=UPI000D863431